MIGYATLGTDNVEKAAAAYDRGYVKTSVTDINP